MTMECAVAILSLADVGSPLGLSHIFPRAPLADPPAGMIPSPSASFCAECCQRGDRRRNDVQLGHT